MDYLEEIACLLGNDYIARLHGNGPVTVLKGIHGQPALIDSLVQHVEEGKALKVWLREHERANGKSKLPPGAWTDRFVVTCNLLRHYPVFVKKQDGTIALIPLNPLPSNISFDDWGAFIGFEKHPQEHFASSDYKKHYTMDIVSSTGLARTEHLGPRYSDAKNPRVKATELLPIFARLSLGATVESAPISAEPVSCLKHWLLHRGIAACESDTDETMRQFVRRALRESRLVLPPSMTLEPVAWVGFEPLDPDEVGDKCDDWVSQNVAGVLRNCVAVALISLCVSISEP